jgi:hypothetical protein
MARRRPRHGQNANSRAHVFPVLVTLVLLACSPVVLQVHGAAPLKLAVVAAATIGTIVTWQFWPQKWRGGLGAAETPAAERPGYTPAEPPQKEDTPPL